VIQPADLLEGDPYAARLGIKLVEAGNGVVMVEMEVTEAMINFHGVAHGGVLFSLADCAFSLASNAPGPRAVAIATHLAFTAPARIGDRLTAIAEEVARGRTMGTYRVTVRRQDQRVVAVFTGTVHIDTPSIASPPLSTPEP
jgi:acyl-CoA thioesterase